MSSRTPEQRKRDERLVERALLGELLPTDHDRRIHTKVVGVTYTNEDGSSRQAAIGSIAQFEEVLLERCPDDDHDLNAIRVIARIRGKGSVDNIVVGFLDRVSAAELASEMDEGRTWRAIATRVGGFPSLGLSLMLFRMI